MTQYSPPIKICLATTELATGGAEKCLVNLARGLPKEHFSVQVLSLAPLPMAPKDQLLKRLQDNEIPVNTLNITSTRQFLTANKRLRHYLADNRFDLLQTFLYHFNVMGALAKKRFPALLHVSGIRVADPSRWRQFLERRVAHRWTHATCVSLDVATFSQQRLGLNTKDITVIPNGIEAEDYANKRSDRRTLLGTTSDRRWLLTIGRLESQKGLDWLIKLAPHLLDKSPQHDLVIVGDGSQRSDLEALARKGNLENRIHFLGWRPDVAELLNAADLLLLPSRWEGMPNVLLEAMASSLPVATMPVHGVSQILGDLGDQQITQDTSPDGFTNHVLRLLAQPEQLVSLGRRNRDRILTQFTLEEMIQRYATLYRQLLTQR